MPFIGGKKMTAQEVHWAVVLPSNEKPLASYKAKFYL